MYFKTSAKFGKFEYNNLFTKALNPNFNNVMNVTNPVSANSLYPSKFVSFNTLTYKLNQRWQISLVEALVMSEYLEWWVVPVYSLTPFVRNTYIEHQNKLTNNLVGLNLSYQNPNIGIFYSQFIVDRFYEWYYPIAAFQFGYKSFDFAGVKNLYLQLEYNRVPREMYLHRNNDLHFGHYNQTLAHPAGAGFNELVAIADYKYKRFEVLAKTVFLKYSPTYGFFNRQNIFDYNQLFQDNAVLNDRSATLMSDIALIYNLNPSYRLQIFTSVSNRYNVEFGSSSIFYQIGIRSAIRGNYYDY
jgi:hypothetical protein